MSAHFTAAAGARLHDAQGRLRPLDCAVGTRPDDEAGLLAAALAAAGRSTFCLAPPALTTGPPLDPPAFETRTGGTTAAPRRIRRSQQSWIDSFEVNRAAWSLGPHSEIAALGSLAHSLAQYAAFEALHAGAGFHLLAGLRPDRQAEAILARAVTLLWATPSQLRLLRGAPAAGVRRLVVGGGALDAATRAKAQALFPEAEITEFYGAAETSFITWSDASTPAGSAGRPYPGVELRIRNVEADGNGLVWVKSNYLFAGYGDDPDPMRDTEGFTTVHERGHLDAAGNLILAGRADRVLRIAEQTVQPERVEAVLLELPGVIEAAAVPRADEKRGAVLVAACILAPDAPRPHRLLAAAREALGPLAAPRTLTPLSARDWPRRPSGKTDLAALAQLLEQAGREGEA